MVTTPVNRVLRAGGVGLPTLSTAAPARRSAQGQRPVARFRARQILALPRRELPHPVRAPGGRTAGARSRGRAPAFDLPARL